MSYLKGHIHYEPRQNEPLDDTQAQNKAGGYVFKIDMYDAVRRFLIMGTESGTYYESERDLTKQNLDNLKAAMAKDGEKVIEIAREISVDGRAKKNDMAIFTLALGLTIGDERTKKAVENVFNEVVRTGSHLLMAVDFIDQMRGWGRVPRRIVGKWYFSKPEDQLAYQVVKYRKRNDWTHKDAMRRVRQGPNTSLYRWIVGAQKYTERVFERRVGGAARYEHTELTGLPKLIDAFEAVQHMGKENPENIVKPEAVIPYIEEHRLTWEMLPTKFLKSPKVWEALLEEMPLGALLRNLGRMTALEMFPQMSPLSKEVCEKFTPERVKKARLHPLAIISALKVYESGKGMKGSLTWSPNSWIVKRLGEAFYWSFDAIEPTNKPLLIALDVSPSMFGTYNAPMANSPLTCGEIAAVMSMVTARVEPYHHICAFDTEFVEIPITAQMSLIDVMNVVCDRPKWGGTDCALPMLEAWKRKWHNIEGFVCYTDNETWAGDVHPKRALDMYRQKTGLDSRLAVSAMTGTDTSIADPNTNYMMDFCGFGTDTPRMMAMFLNGEI